MSYAEGKEISEEKYVFMSYSWLIQSNLYLSHIPTAPSSCTLTAEKNFRKYIDD